MTDVDCLTEELVNAHRIAVLTGAGISTESGIPDYRSAGGLWRQIKPIYFDDFVSSAAARRESWDRIFKSGGMMKGAMPNAGHVAVAELVTIGKTTNIITQNVDNLHQASGVPAEKIIELHGNASFARCLTCGAHHDYAVLKPRWLAEEELTCDQCGGLLKSATISFGQSMPLAEMERAETEARQCDLMLVLGTSLEVHPAAELPLVAKYSGARLVFVNLDDTPLDAHADIVISTKIGPLLSAAISKLKAQTGT